jgi:hypothetical protein
VQSEPGARSAEPDAASHGRPTSSPFRSQDRRSQGVEAVRPAEHRATPISPCVPRPRCVEGASAVQSSGTSRGPVRLVVGATEALTDVPQSSSWTIYALAITL